MADNLLTVVVLQVGIHRYAKIVGDVVNSSTLGLNKWWLNVYTRTLFHVVVKEKAHERRMETCA